MTGDTTSKDPEDTQESHQPDSSSQPDHGTQTTVEFPHAFFNDKTAIGVMIVVIIIFVIVGWFIMPRHRLSRFETGAIDGLRRIGQSQAAYVVSSGSQYGVNYGTLDALITTGYYQPGTTLENFLDGYRLRWKLGRHHPNCSTERFTVIAYPASGSESLRTFAITNSMMLREFNADSSSDEYDIGTWDSVISE